MSELTDRLAGETILASFHNAVKERTMMRYANLAALDASIALPDPGSFAYLTTYPYPKTTGGTGFGGDGTPFVWAEDGDDTSPFSSGYRWQALIRDSGGQMFGPLTFHGSDPGSELDPLSQFWKIDSTDDWRFRLLQANDGESGVNVLSFSGDVGGSNYMRIPKSGTWGVRERTGSQEFLTIYDGEAVELPQAADTDDGSVSFTPLRFVNPTEWGPASGEIGIYSLKTIGSPQLAISRLDATAERCLAISGVVASGSNTWRVGTTAYEGVNGADVYSLERGVSSSQRWKVDIAAAVRADAAAILAALDVVTFQYAPGYLAAGDEREGVTVVGMIAEQVAEVSSGLADHDDDGQPMNYDDRQISALLVAAVQDLGERVGVLEDA